MTALAIIHKQTIIERIATGERITDIAQSIGVSHTAIQPLQDDPEYQQAVQAGIESRLDKREREMETCSDQLSFARTRELLSHTRWLAERLNRDKYGKDTVPGNNIQPVFNITVSNAPPQYVYEQDEHGGANVHRQG